ncbi:hypothetical protein BCV70DRAFT_118819 [Testicularia cyperi]|uniref:CNH domain-containing protein n=1 Tax=Testicularia cyperi TaxID=1882483 RepID=A0A317XMA9_9BASI|nr:hypothetical protein BCV70DRAFT_118819 [Testicularia cyperi]
MHTAFDAAPLLSGVKGKPEALVVHGVKLILGSASGSLNIYRLDQASSTSKSTQNDDESEGGDASSIASTSRDASPRKPGPQASSRTAISTSITGPSTSTWSRPVQTAEGFSRRPIEQLGVIKETNQLVSLSDGYVSLHDLATLEPHVQLTQTKGALTFSIDTSIQKRLANAAPDYGPGPLGGGRASVRGTQFLPPSAHTGRAFRPGAVGDLNNNGGQTGTISRNRMSVFDIPSKDWQAASMRGMDAMAKYKEQERRKAMEEARYGGGGGAADGESNENGIMTLVTVLAVGLKRKIIFFRWVDGEFWDTREIGLQHTPRSLAFVTPTKLFMGYNATEYGVLAIPLAADSTVSYTHPSSSYGGSSSNASRREPVAHPPTNSTSGPLVDLTSPTLSAWHVDDFDIAETLEAAGGGTGDGTGNTSQSGGAAANTSTQSSAAATGFGAALGGLGGLGGYVGLGSKGKMSVLQVDGGEVLFVHATSGLFLGADGRPTRREGIDWPFNPLEVAFARPYVFALLPPGSVPALKNSSLPNANFPILQIRSIGTLYAVQTLCFPPLSTSSTSRPKPTPAASSSLLTSSLSLSSSSSASVTPPQVRLLTTSSSSKPPVYVVVSPSDRTTLEKEGSVVWRLEMQGWSRQIDELVEKGEFEEALGLLDSVDNVILEDKDERRAHVQSLYALTLFADGKFDDAIEMFMELDTNPAKVIALYPNSVAGDLTRSKSEWFPIFGGKTPARMLGASSVEGRGDHDADASQLSSSPTPSHATAQSVAGTARSRLGAFLPARRPQSIIGESMLGSSPTQSSPGKPRPAGRSALGQGQDAESMAETGSIRSVKTTAREAPEMKATSSTATATSTGTGTGINDAGVDPANRKALDALGRFLADRRRIFKPILEADPHLESKDHMAMSQIKRDTNWLLSLPNRPFADLDKEELIATAQTVDTALFKVFLETKPALLGPLCRIENWCEVEQVEELLKQRKKFSELIALYGGKEMHSKALGLLQQFAEDEDEDEEKVRPTMQYLQNLGPEFIDTILETSHWVLRLNATLGIEIFTADTGRVGSWPRLNIVDDLNTFDKDLCAIYLEHIITNADEADPELHDKLIRLYLGKAAKLRQETSGATPNTETDDDPVKGRAKVMQKLLGFLRSSTQYRPEQILVRLPADDDDRDMYEARALLLGRMGQHEGALGIYVRKLDDLVMAEEYCKDVWQALKRSIANKTGAYAPPYSATNARRGTTRRPQIQTKVPPQSIFIDDEQKQRADKEVFLTLVKIYLNASSTAPGSASGSDRDRAGMRLEAALGILERHAAKIDLGAALGLLPAQSVSLYQVSKFININLRDQTRQQNEAAILKQISAARSQQLQDTRMRLESRRVRVEEHRTCPACHKRLGNSVVAVNPVSGAVLHYFCSIHGQSSQSH